MEKLTLIIPPKEEAESLRKVLLELKNYSYKIIIILEKSDIKTLEAIKNFECKIVYHSGRGYGNALIEGIKNVKTKYIFNVKKHHDRLHLDNRDKPFKFKRGTVAFAKSKSGNAEDSEFFILLADAFLFEGEYTPLGRVVNGISALEKIKFNDQSEYVLRPDFINSLNMFSDIN